MYYVYILESGKDDKFYIGYTADLERRIYEHRNGRARATKNRLPMTLVYYEAYLNQKDATGREMFLKSGSGHRFVKKQLVNYLASKKNIQKF
ncbi:MAG: GIY-YIG nuclease family protein [bacterium]|nr:GIY-YIG nuclease family protein [bacterium]